jgi:hypothetical protein
LHAAFWVDNQVFLKIFVQLHAAAPTSPEQTLRWYSAYRTCPPASSASYFAFARQKTMDVNPEKLISELYEMVAQERDYVELRRLITRLIECLEARQQERTQAQHNSPSQKPST